MTRMQGTWGDTIRTYSESNDGCKRHIRYNYMTIVHVPASFYEKRKSNGGKNKIYVKCYPFSVGFAEK
jgi:hypothetical protein